MNAGVNSAYEYFYTGKGSLYGEAGSREKADEKAQPQPAGSSQCVKKWARLSSLLWPAPEHGSCVFGVGRERENGEGGEEEDAGRGEASDRHTKGT